MDAQCVMLMMSGLAKKKLNTIFQLGHLLPIGFDQKISNVFTYLCVGRDDF